MNLWTDDNASMMEAFMASSDLHSYPWVPSPAPTSDPPRAMPPSTMAPPAPAAYLNQDTLQHRLQSLIEGSRESWTYAIFWQSSVDVSTGSSLLGWGDGYYKGCSEEDKRKGKSFASAAATSAADQEHRKRVLREFNSLISGGSGGSPDEAVDEEVTDTEWFFLVSMTQSFMNGARLPSQAMLSGLPQWIDGAEKLEIAPCERARPAHQFGMQTMVCVPVGTGVLELGSTDLIFQSHEIMSKIRLLFNFNGFEAGAAGRSSWIQPQTVAAAGLGGQGETDPSLIEIKDSVSPASATVKTEISATEISVSKPPPQVQFENHLGNSSSFAENPSSIQLQHHQFNSHHHHHHHHQQHQQNGGVASFNNIQTQPFTKELNFSEFAQNNNNASSAPQLFKPETGEILNFSESKRNSSSPATGGSTFSHHHQISSDDKRNNKRSNAATSRGSNNNEGMLSISRL